jgi:hypothetical protein
LIKNYRPRLLFEMITKWRIRLYCLILHIWQYLFWQLYI